MGHMVRRAAACAVAGMLACALCVPQAPAFADAEHAGYAATGDYGSQKHVGVYGMTPISGYSVEDGTYSVAVQTSSSFFRFEDVELTVADGQMHAVFTMTSSSYTLVYPGTSEEAAAAPYEDYIEIDPKGDIFEMGIPALNEALPCASFSKKKRKWYSRQILVDASSLPAGALKVELPDYDYIQDAIDAYGEPLPGTEEAAAAEAEREEERQAAMVDPAAANAAAEGPEAVAVDLDDGTYSIEVNMTGGSGRASVSSPTWLVVRDGRAYARLLWSSVYYDYMVVDDTTYWNETTDGGNSTFTIPITAMDDEIAVIADTTAMGDPVEIEYELTFYSDTVGSTRQVPQEAAMSVLELALAVIIGGGILNYALKRKSDRTGKPGGKKGARR